MRKKIGVVALGAILALATQPVFAADGSPSTEKPKAAPAKAEKKQASEPGVLVVETIKAKAKVTAVDAVKRLVTLDMGGKSRSIVCGPEVKNFDQIKVGDLLKIAFVDAVAVFVQKDGGTTTAKDVNTVTLAPKGSKPGMLVTDTVTIKAKVEAVDVKNNTLTLLGLDGNKKVIKVSKNVKGLKDLKKGDDIVVKHTEALAVVVETPAKAPAKK